MCLNPDLSLCENDRIGLSDPFSSEAKLTYSNEIKSWKLYFYYILNFLIHTYMCTNAHTYTYIYIHIHTHIHTYICIHRHRVNDLE